MQPVMSPADGQVLPGRSGRPGDAASPFNDPGLLTGFIFGSCEDSIICTVQNPKTGRIAPAEHVIKKTSAHSAKKSLGVM